MTAMKFRWPWQKPAPTPPPTCQHKYKDFPWYVEAVYYQRACRLECKVIAPFVCVLCKCRKNVVLEEITHDAPKKEANQWLTEHLEDVEDRIQPRTLVESMIADMRLVDRKFLEIVGMLDTYQPTPKIEVPES